MDLTKLGTGTAPKYAKLSDVDMTSFKNGGGVQKGKKGDIGKSGTQYGYTLKEWEEMAEKNGLLVSPTQWWKSQNGKKYVDSFGRNKTIGQHSGDKQHEMNKYGYLIANGMDLGSKIIPLSAKNYVQENNFSKYENGGGVGLIGNQKRIDMNKNGKIDAEDFKLLRSSMNGAWRNERKHVNHNEDYEVRYAKPRPKRTGYKGKRKFGEGGGISTAERFKKVVAKNREANRVKPMSQKMNTGGELGKIYEVQYELNGNKITTKYLLYENDRVEKMLPSNAKIISIKEKMNTGGAFPDYGETVNGKDIDYDMKSYFNRTNKKLIITTKDKKKHKGSVTKHYNDLIFVAEDKFDIPVKDILTVKILEEKAESGVTVKKANRGGVMVLAKKIRKEGESWKDALKRAGQQLK
jgi:hypothetical protein